MLMAPVSQEEATTGEQINDIASVRVLQVELGEPLPGLSSFDEKTGRCYRLARCLVRLHTHPLGIIELVFHQRELSAYDYVQDIWEALHEQINAHLQQDGLLPIKELSPEGITILKPPLCIEQDEAFFAAAPFVSIIVSTHDRTEQLSTCLPALLAQDYPRYEVIIVDNAPTSSTTAELIQHAYGEVSYLRYVREDRPGLSWGLNRGIAAARGEILAFTDDDVIVDPYWLLHLVKSFGIAHNVTCVTGLVLPFELETSAQFLFEEYGGFSKGFQRRVYDMADNHPGEVLYPYTAGRFGTGASMAFRVAFLREIGGFDPALQCGMDIAAFFQVVRHGYKLVYEPDALAFHIHRRTYEGLRKQIHTYGVALTAYLTKGLLEHPQDLFKFLSKIPYGIFFILSSRSPKNRKKLLHYPKNLTNVELQGMLYGPFFYLHRRWKLTAPVGRYYLLQKQAAQ
jgi:GT2 family glycosyltransferase